MLCQEPKLQLKYADKMKKNSLEYRGTKKKRIQREPLLSRLLQGSLQCLDVFFH